MKFDLDSIRKLPAVIAAQAAANQLRCEQRATLLAQLVSTREAFERTDADGGARIAPLQKKIDAHRVTLATLEAELSPLAEALASAKFAMTETVRQLESQLRTDAAEEVREFELEIDAMRAEVCRNLTSRQGTLLGTFASGQPLHDRIVGVMERTLSAYNAAARVAKSEADVTAGLKRLRDGLRAAGIGFLQTP